MAYIIYIIAIFSIFSCKTPAGQGDENRIAYSGDSVLNRSDGNSNVAEKGDSISFAGSDTTAWEETIPTSFKKEQIKNARVITAYKEKEDIIKKLLLNSRINSFSINIFIRIFKKEEELEVWVRSKENDNYILLRQYRFCSNSGTLGPKRKRGDLQIPEGFYHISHFNPWSNFYLSLGLNYPNASDKILGDRVNPGGDIFIHGDCVTIGCVPITDDKIKELYILAVEAKAAGQAKIPVHIFPGRFDDENFEELKDSYAGEDTMIKFWKNLKEGYTYFENCNKLPDVNINVSGEYIFTDNCK